MVKLKDRRIECEICGEIFVPNCANHRRCSPKCAEIAREQEREEAYREGRWTIFNRDGFQCFYCGMSSYGNKVQLHVDHIIPRVDGGKDIAGNLVTACVDCNCQKAANEIFDLGPIMEEIAKRNRMVGLNSSRKVKLKRFS